MLSQNLVDEFFTELFKNIINKTTDLKLKHNSSQIEPLNSYARHFKISHKSQSHSKFGAEYTEALLDLVYIDAEARSFLLDKLITLKKVDRDRRVVQIYQSVVSENLDEKKALNALS